MAELNIPEDQASKIKEEILHKEGENLRKKRQKISIFDFVPIKIIGKGAFGEVRLCKYIPTDDIVAIKKMKKEEMHKKNQVLHVRGKESMDCRIKIFFSRSELFIPWNGVPTWRRFNDSSYG